MSPSPIATQATQAAPQGKEQPITTAALGKAHPYSMGTCLHPLEVKVLRSHSLGVMTTWPIGKDGMAGAHFDTAHDLHMAQMMLSAIRSYYTQEAQQNARLSRR